MVATRSSVRATGQQLWGQSNMNRGWRVNNRIRRWVKRYRPNDHTRRHRIMDEQPKTVRVTGYNRRT